MLQRKPRSRLRRRLPSLARAMASATCYRAWLLRILLAFSNRNPGLISGLATAPPKPAGYSTIPITILTTRCCRWVRAIGCDSPRRRWRRIAQHKQRVSSAGFESPGEPPRPTLLFYEEGLGPTPKGGETRR